MIQQYIDDLKGRAGSAVRMTSLAVVIAALLFIGLAFLCAALFVYVLQTYDVIYACLAIAAVFIVAAVIAAGLLAYQKRKAEEAAAAAAAARPTTASALADPVVVAMGLQIVKTVGVKRLVPILAVAGVALGFLAARHMTSDGEDKGKGDSPKA